MSIAMPSVMGKEFSWMHQTNTLASNILLDPACLNGKGRIVDPSKIRLDRADKHTQNAYRRNAVWNVVLENYGIAKAKLEVSHENIAGYIARDRIRDKGSYEKYMEDQNRPG